MVFMGLAALILPFQLLYFELFSIGASHRPDPISSNTVTIGDDDGEIFARNVLEQMGMSNEH